MDVKQAIKLAIKCIDAQAQHLAFDANLYCFGEHEQNIPHIAKAHKTYTQYKEAKQLLTDLSKEITETENRHRVLNLQKVEF